jgi:predicted aspartyl protease
MRRCRLLRILAPLAALGALAACMAPSRTATHADACRPERRAELALRDARHFLLAPARLDGQTATLLIDTGAETTTLTPAAAAALRLPPDPAHARTLAGITGNVRSASVTLRRLSLGDTIVASGRSVAVGALPSLDGLDPPVAGLLGADVLAGYEVELDLPEGRMALYAPNVCPGWRPWPDAIAVPFERSLSGLARLDVQVDGRAVRALLDTGARTSLLTRKTALALGVTAPMLAADAARTGVGVGGGSAMFRRHRFGAVGLPGATERDMLVNVADLRLPDVEMLLGADFLGRRQVWISYATGRLFLH